MAGYAWFELVEGAEVWAATCGRREAADSVEALELCHALRPDLVLMEVRMTKMDGLAATRAIKAQSPKTSVVMVTMQDDPDYLFEAVIAGAAGYVLKGATPDQLTPARRRYCACWPRCGPTPRSRASSS